MSFVYGWTLLAAVHSFVHYVSAECLFKERDIETSGGSAVIRFLADNLVLKIFATIRVLLGEDILDGQLAGFGVSLDIYIYIYIYMCMFLLTAVCKYPYISSVNFFTLIFVLFILVHL